MAEGLNYIDLPALGATNGVLEYQFHAVKNLDHGYAFVYGANDEELAEQVALRKQRVDFARSNPYLWKHPDGYSMAKRETIISEIIQRGMPMRIVDVEFYPPFEDPEVQQSEMEKLTTLMSEANDKDIDKINRRLTVLGMTDLVA